MSVGPILPMIRVEGRTFGPSARELFPVLRVILLNSRPVIGQRVTYPPLRKGQKTAKGISTPIYGPPTFRNSVDENGRLT